ncbi:MAG: LemA family protein [Bacilli bacterium]
MKILILILIILFIMSILMFNIMMSKKNKVYNAFSSMDVMLKKRYDLVPNLVKVVKEFDNYESDVLRNVTKLRTTLLETSSTDEIFEKNMLLEKNIKTILYISENNPKLSSNQNYLELQRSLVELENQISAARRTYNAQVTNYNNFIQIFPNNIFAYIFNFKKFAWFEFTENSDVKVDLYE